MPAHATRNSMRQMPTPDAYPRAAIPLLPPRASPAARPAAPSDGWRRSARSLSARRLLLTAALLLAPALAAPGALAQSPPAGVAGVTPGGAMQGGTVPSGESGMATPRMPRPGSSTTFEPGEARHGNRKTAEQRFEAANTTHDGHLTEAQAQAAHMRGVATHFAEIDSHHRGYITLEEIRAWRAERRAEHKAAREKAAK